VLVLEAQRLIRAPAEHVFNHLAQADHLTRYAAPLWMTAEPAEKRGAAQTVALRGYFAGLPVESVQRVTLRPPTSLECVQLRGTLRAFSAQCTLRSTEDGTEVLYRLEVDPGIPMLTEDAARQFLFQHLGRMLDRVKLAAERKTPGRRVTRAVAASVALPVSPGLADEDVAEPAEPAEPLAEAAVPVAEPAGPAPRRVPVEAPRPAAHASKRPPQVRQRPGARRPGPVAPRAAVPVPPPPAPASHDAVAGGAAQGKKRRRRRRRRRSESAPPPPPERNA